MLCKIYYTYRQVFSWWYLPNINLLNERITLWLWRYSTSMGQHGLSLVKLRDLFTSQLFPLVVTMLFDCISTFDMLNSI